MYDNNSLNIISQVRIDCIKPILNIDEALILYQKMGFIFQSKTSYEGSLILQKVSEIFSNLVGKLVNKLSA